VNSTHAPSFRQALRHPSTLFVAAAIVCAFCVSSAAAQPLQSKVNTLIRRANLSHVKMAVALVDLSDGRTLARIRADEAMIPASNMKVVTTAAALSRMSPEFTFRTQLRTDGETLYIIGDGDPGFGDPELLKPLGMTPDDLVNRWVEVIGKMETKRFNEIVIDDRVFDDDLVQQHWPNNQLHKWYCAQVAGLNFNDNCVDFFVETTELGRPANVRLQPSSPPIELECEVTTGRKHRPIIGRHLGGNRIVFNGTVSTTPESPYSVTVHDPAMFFAGTLKNRLEAEDIKVDAVRRAESGERLPEGHLLASVRTPLPVAITRCNRDSQNLFAEALLKRLGHHMTGHPGSWANGSDAIVRFLEEIGVDTNNVTIDDGSGMSRYNRISAEALVDVLKHMHRDDNLAKMYRDSLARPGKPGTLENRFRHTDLDCQVYAKSGYLSGVYALSGYVVHDGRTIAFACLVNSFRPPKKGRYTTPKQLFEQIVNAADEYLAEQAQTARN